MEIKPKNGGGRLSWHPAFFQAVQQELIDYQDSLEYSYEHNLTSEPLRIDLLIIKKQRDITIDKNIARIFRTDNLLEYKSPDDFLSVKDYLKVYAYANLYAAITPGVNFADITLTFIASRHPRKLLKYLTGTRGYRVEETSAGIYRVSGDYVPIQIIESGKLPERENLWLKSLTVGLQAGSVDSILNEVQKRGNKNAVSAYLEARNMARRKYPTLVEVLTESGDLAEWEIKWEARGKAEGRAEVARNALAEGASPDFVRKITGLPLETIASLK